VTGERVERFLSLNAERTLCNEDRLKGLSMRRIMFQSVREVESADGCLSCKVPGDTENKDKCAVSRSCQLQGSERGQGARGYRLVAITSVGRLQ